MEDGEAVGWTAAPEVEEGEDQQEERADIHPSVARTALGEGEGEGEGATRGATGDTGDGRLVGGGGQTPPPPRGGEGWKVGKGTGGQRR